MVGTEFQVGRVRACWPGPVSKLAGSEIKSGFQIGVGGPSGTRGHVGRVQVSSWLGPSGACWAGPGFKWVGPIRGMLAGSGFKLGPSKECWHPAFKLGPSRAR